MQVLLAYYSAFQHIKAYLINKGFDYKSFIQNKPREREFSHGTIQAAIALCLKSHGKSQDDINKLK
jgi:uncharacterized protein (UPF0332 family)